MPSYIDFSETGKSLPETLRPANGSDIVASTVEADQGKKLCSSKISHRYCLNRREISLAPNNDLTSCQTEDQSLFVYV